jgi:lipoprotein-releasing system permease protein
MTLISVLAVMNGFQLGFIEDILEISSYHIRIQPKGQQLSSASVEQIEELDSVRAVVPFIDVQTLAQGMYPAFEACLVRGVEPDAAEKDRKLIEQLHLVAGSFDLTGKQTIVIGEELARELGLGLGNTITLMSLVGESFGGLSAKNYEYTITGIFKSGYYEFDKTMGFVNIKQAETFVSSEEGITYGVKIENRFRDREVRHRIEKILSAEAESIISWREYNSSFFGALRTEKLIMMVLIGLIFIVVGVNIYHSLKRTVYERIEEISVLRATGGSPLAVRTIFIIDGLFTGFLGGSIGLLAGLLISVNINFLFSFIERLVNGVLRVLQVFIMPLIGSGGESFTLFSPRYYYLTEVPTRVLLPETIIVFLFAVLSSGVAAFFASQYITRIRPSEVLRYE